MPAGTLLAPTPTFRTTVGNNSAVNTGMMALLAEAENLATMASAVPIHCVGSPGITRKSVAVTMMTRVPRVESDYNLGGEIPSRIVCARLRCGTSSVRMHATPLTTRVRQNGQRRPILRRIRMLSAIEGTSTRPAGWYRSIIRKSTERGALAAPIPHRRT